jgi:hypothetical protein
MPKKRDPSVTFLNRFGYNVVRLPRAGIEPLDVIGRDETTEWLGPLSSVWTSAVAVPAPSPPRPAVAVNGQKTDKLDASFGLRILANALAAFGAAVPSLEFAYRGARTIQFSYSNVTSTVVPPFEAGNYLARGTLKTDNPVVRRYFLDQESEAFLILDVLKSDSITVTAADENGRELAVDVPTIQGMIGAAVSVKSAGAANSTLTFSGPAPVTFGFMLDAIEFDGSRWSLRGAAPSGGLALASGAAAAGVDAPAPILLGVGCRVRI